MSDNMKTLNRLADIAVEIDELKDTLSDDCKKALATIAWAVHEIVELEAGDRAAEIYGQEDVAA